MEKEFVSYEQAVALKELGFKYEKFYNYTSPMTNLAPLKQQVFRWFREKCNMLANVYANASGFLFEYHDTIGGTHRYHSGVSGPNAGGCWDTYEEAEDACIDKLIELAKQQDNV